jgi:hypothetical protein
MAKPTSLGIVACVATVLISCGFSFWRLAQPSSSADTDIPSADVQEQSPDSSDSPK